MATELSVAFNSLYDQLPIISGGDDRGVTVSIPGTEVRIHGFFVPADNRKVLDLAQHPVIAQPDGERPANMVGVLTITENAPGLNYDIRGYNAINSPVDVVEAEVPQLLASLADALQSPGKPRSLRSLQPSSVLYLLEE